MADLYEYQPLAAYVKLKILNNTEADSASYDWDVSSIGSLDSSASEANDIVVDFNWKKPGSKGGNMCFNITLFDETAIVLESKIAGAGQNPVGLKLEYGWCSNGQSVPERCVALDGEVREYSISFNGPSTELSVVGMFKADRILSGCSTTEFPASKYHGNPSEIIRELCRRNGWDASEVDDTENVMQSGDMKQEKTYVQGGKSLKQFIENDLCVDAHTEEGQSAFRFYVDSSVKPPKAYFKPETELTAGGVDIKLMDEYGNSGSRTYAGGSAEKALSSAREYNIYVGHENNEVINFTPQYTFSAGAGLAASVMAISPETSEIFMCDVGGTALTVSEDADKLEQLTGSRVLGMSGAGFLDIANRSKRLWNTFANISVTATLEILGDPQFKPLAENSNRVTVNVYTKYGLKHHTSGVYNIVSVTDAVSGGLYTTTLELVKMLAAGQNQYYGKENVAGNGTNPETTPDTPTQPPPTATPAGTVDNDVQYPSDGYPLIPSNPPIA